MNTHKKRCRRAEDPVIVIPLHKPPSSSSLPVSDKRSIKARPAENSAIFLCLDFPVARCCTDQPAGGGRTGSWTSPAAQKNGGSSIFRGSKVKPSTCSKIERPGLSPRFDQHSADRATSQGFFRCVQHACRFRRGDNNQPAWIETESGQSGSIEFTHFKGSKILANP